MDKIINLPISLHLIDKIDIILIASITLLGFMVTSLSIFKMIILNKKIPNSLYKDIISLFKISIYLLLASTILSTLGFLFIKCLYIAFFMSIFSFLLFFISLFIVYKIVKIIFILEEN